MSGAAFAAVGSGLRLWRRKRRKLLRRGFRRCRSMRSWRLSITGHGSVSAVLAGTKLTVTGTFEGMHSAATAAHLHQSKTTGVRGVVIHELTVSKAMGGTFPVRSN